MAFMKRQPGFISTRPHPEGRRGRYLHGGSSHVRRVAARDIGRIATADFSTENVGKLVDILRTATLNP
ncbi:hypothetical protein OH687_31485 [Burkholderia anthina]|nr:hypothetical protein OH687_31485 [Burkholderia anthina]